MAGVSIEDFEAGSGSDVCTSTTEHACPSQCFWCVEASRCAQEWQECALPPSPAPVMWPVLVVVCAAAALLYYQCRQPEPLVPPHADADGSAYQLTDSTRSEQRRRDEDDGPARRAPRSPEGQRLLSP